MQLETCIKQGELKAKYKYIFCINHYHYLLDANNANDNGQVDKKAKGGKPLHGLKA